MTTTTTTAGGVKVVKPTVAGHLHDYWGRVRGGDLGSLPAVLGLIVLSLIFAIARDTFFSPLNFANLFTQSAQVVFIAMGLIFVLLLGEIVRLPRWTGLAVGFAGVLVIVWPDAGVTPSPWHLAALATRARELRAGRVWIDMEGSDYTEATVALYEQLLPEHPNLGICLQAYLKRTAVDIERLRAIRRSRARRRCRWSAASGPSTR